jgi:hypothetical protein
MTKIASLMQQEISGAICSGPASNKEIGSLEKW